MHPVLIQIGPLVIRWYGVMIAIACLLGIWVAGREAERKGVDREKRQLRWNHRNCFPYGAL